MRFGTGRSASQHSFAVVPRANIPRSAFNRQRSLKTAFDASYLVPIFVDEVLPGDTFNVQGNYFARLSTPTVPFMDNLYLDTFYFFVPNRLVWDHWEKFNGAQDNPGDSTSFTVPQMTACKPQVGDLYDYFGVPTNTANNIQFNNLHGRAYNLIWNQWFRDQNLQNSITVDTGAGPDTYANYTSLQKRGKRHDYFTSCLPWTQKGTAQSIPLGTSATVSLVSTTGTPGIFRMASDHSLDVSDASVGTDSGGHVASNTHSATVAYDPNGTLFADLSGASAATINQLRQAFKIQELYERDARGGTRYTEILRAHFGVISPDFRLQRAEYLGGGSTPIKINPVAQTTSTGQSGSTTPQGNLAAFGTGFARSGFVKSFVEHGVIIGLANVRADLTYQQGLDKMWQRQSRFDFYWPELSQIGEQAVLNNEIYCDGSGNDSLVFGYQERYGEYRYSRSMVTGKMRSTYSTPLDIWHLAIKFGSLPALNSTFIVDSANTAVSRVVAVNTEPQFLMDAFFNVKCARPMPLFGTPLTLGRF